jgi:hypothetical protein
MTEAADVRRVVTTAVAQRLAVLEAHCRRLADLAREATNPALPLTHRQMAASVLAQIAKETP